MKNCSVVLSIDQWSAACDFKNSQSYIFRLFCTPNPVGFPSRVDRQAHTLLRFILNVAYYEMLTWRLT
jgi:hypothetical protein